MRGRDPLSSVGSRGQLICGMIPIGPTKFARSLLYLINQNPHRKQPSRAPTSWTRRLRIMDRGAAYATHRRLLPRSRWGDPTPSSFFMQVTRCAAIRTRSGVSIAVARGPDDDRRAKKVAGEPHAYGAANPRSPIRGEPRGLSRFLETFVTRDR